jgi:hypothetical protein
MTIIARPPRWGPFVLVVVVLYLAVQWAVQWRMQHPPPPAALTAADTTATDSAATDRLIARALAQAPATPPDSTRIKTGWRDEVCGIDLAVFTPPQREAFLRLANAEACPCAGGFTLAACREDDSICPGSLARAEALRDSVLAGKVRSATGPRRRPRRRGQDADRDVGDNTTSAPGAQPRRGTLIESVDARAGAD